MAPPNGPQEVAVTLAEADSGTATWKNTRSSRRFTMKKVSGGKLAGGLISALISRHPVSWTTASLPGVPCGPGRPGSPGKDAVVQDTEGRDCGISTPGVYPLPHALIYQFLLVARGFAASTVVILGALPLPFDWLQRRQMTW